MAVFPPIGFDAQSIKREASRKRLEEEKSALRSDERRAANAPRLPRKPAPAILSAGAVARSGGSVAQPETFSDFWPVYVLAHRQPLTRGFHFVGSLAGWALFLAAIWRRQPWWLATAIVVPYALAWISHFFVEHNRPASFGHPLWSWLADQRMVSLMLVGRMNEEVRRCKERAA